MVYNRDILTCHEPQWDCFQSSSEWELLVQSAPAQHGCQWPALHHSSNSAGTESPSAAGEAAGEGGESTSL